jgi:hypothetical protein
MQISRRNSGSRSAADQQRQCCRAHEKTGANTESACVLVAINSRGAADARGRATATQRMTRKTGDGRLRDGRRSAAMRNDQPEGGRRRLSHHHWCRIGNDTRPESDVAGGRAAAGKRTANAAKVRNRTVLMPILIVRVGMGRCDNQPKAQYRDQQAAYATPPRATDPKCSDVCHAFEEALDSLSAKIP